MSCIHFKQVSKSFGQHQALKNINLSFAEDCTTAIVGASASGKSTLLKLINGLVIPDQGEVQVFNQPIDYTDLKSLRRRIGYAVQSAALFPHLKVRENIILMAKLTGWQADRIQQRLEFLLELMGLPEKLLARYPHQLSGGQQQRISLCRAMMLNHPLLLLDEPFSALDPITRHEIQNEFISIQQAEKHSIILVTHDMKEAVKLAHHIVIMHHGEIAQASTMEQVLDDPQPGYVSSLLREQLN
jgi:osmoprotectant transport system ATP-binding protein